MLICTYIYTHTHTYMYMCISIYTYTYTYMYNFIVNYFDISKLNGYTPEATILWATCPEYTKYKGES